MCCRVFISGFVQGVGYRRFVKYHAVKIGLMGWVKNLPDNRVEAVFQSSVSPDQAAKDQIEKMITICRKGPFLSEVKSITVEWQDGIQVKVDKLRTFEVM